ncbi:MAG: hypothetical protein ACTSPY_08955 [Candidatus Helarchaeota archaeon]
MVTIKENAMKLLKGMYDDWIENLLLRSREDLKKALQNLGIEDKDFIRARVYCEDKKYVMIVDGNPPKYRISAEGIDIIEENIN